MTTIIQPPISNVFKLFFHIKPHNKILANIMLMSTFKIWEIHTIIWVVLFFSLKLLSSVLLLSCVQLFATPWIAARQASLSITNSWILLELMPIESVMPSSHLILCRPLLLLPPIPRSIRVFSKESALRMRWPKSWSFSCSFCQTSPPWPDQLGWPHMVWLSFIELDKAVVLWSDWLVSVTLSF